MPKLINKDTGKVIGAVTQSDVQFLIDQLEEEDLQDTDYFISADTVRFLEDNGASGELLDILRATLVEMYGEEILELPEEDEDEEDFDDDDEGDDDEPMELEDEEFEDVEVLGFELTWKD
jgi:hypothetical protein